MASFYIIPGLGNSGPQHWQTWMEESSTEFTRIQQQNWEAPHCEEWISNIEQALNPEKLSETILIGHSMGCSAIVHWATRYGKKVKGAFLVAPSDIENPVYTFEQHGFIPIPLEKLSFPSLVIASSNDPWVSLERAAFFAEKWGSELINVGTKGHINTDAGLGPWPEGMELLQKFVTSL